jgi:hypothetical protein
MLLLLLAVLVGAASPVTAELVGPSVALASAAELAETADRSGYPGVIEDSGEPLSRAHLARALLRRAHLTGEQRAELDVILTSAAPAAQLYLTRAFAAGHPVSELAGFAVLLARRDRSWLKTRLQLIDATGTGPVRFGGTTVSQYDDTTCGPTTILAARAWVDPIYAFDLTTAGRPGGDEESGSRFRHRLRVEEQSIHDQTDVLWPQTAGTPPWGLTELLNRQPDGLGVRYRWIAVARTLPALADAVLRRSLAAVEQGYPVPMLIGDLIPRHYVLLVGHDPQGALFYEPSAGELVRVSAAEVERHDFSRLGFRHLHGAILPGGPVTG